MSDVGKKPNVGVIIASVIVLAGGATSLVLSQEDKLNWDFIKDNKKYVSYGFAGVSVLAGFALGLAI